MNGRGVHRGGTFVLSFAMVAIGGAILVQSIASSASPASGRARALGRWVRRGVVRGGGGRADLGRGQAGGGAVSADGASPDGAAGAQAIPPGNGAPPPHAGGPEHERRTAELAARSRTIA